MKFVTRPDLSNQQFQQLSGSTLILSGETNFIGTLKSKNIEIDASVSDINSMTGHVLTFLPSGKIALAPTSATQLFDSNRTTTRQGIPNVNVGGNTIVDFLEGYFFPSVPPSPTLSVSPSIRQFGNSSTGNLNWSVVRNTNPITSIIVDGQSFIPTGNNQSGVKPYSVSAANHTPATGTTQRTQVYNMTVQTASETVNTNTNITWRHRRFWFKSSIVYNTSNTVALNNLLLSLTDTNREFATNRTKTFSPIAFSSEFFYYAYPKSFGFGASQYIVNGLVNNAWGNPNTGTLFEFTFQNSDNYFETYYVARSDNQLNATFNIVSS